MSNIDLNNSYIEQKFADRSFDNEEKPLQIEPEDQQIQQIFKKVMEQFDLVEDQLVYKDDGTETGISSSDLLNGLFAAFAVKNQPISEQKAFKFWHNEKGEKTHLVKKIGSGAYSKVYFFVDLNQGFAGVFKDARRKGLSRVIERARPDVENEFHLLTYSHQEGKRWGIQSKPRKCTYIAVQSKRNPRGPLKERFGSIGQKYDHNYDTEIGIVGFNKNIEDYLLDFHQLLGGLKNLDDLNILHGDIKLENILVKKRPTMNYVHLSDFGGACRADKDCPLRELVTMGGERIGTANYIVLSDLDQNLQFADEGNREEVIRIEKKRDVFAMGSVLYYTLTGNFPYLLDDNGYPKELEKYYEITNRGIPKEVKDLIKKMAASNPDDRPTAGEAFTILDQLIQKDYPGVYAKIEAEMAKGYVI